MTTSRDSALAAAIACLGQGEWRRARARFQELAQVLPEEARVHQGLAVACLQLGEAEDARAAAARALQLQPSWNQAELALSEAHAALGREASEQKDWPAAAEQFRHAIALRPEVGELHCNLAVALLRQGQLTAALEQSQRALALLPDHAEAQNTQGTVLQELGQLREAEGHYRRALELSPEHAHARSNLGSLQHQRGDLASAIRSYRKHLQIHPGDVRSNVNLAGALLLSGEHTEGWKHYEARLQQSAAIMAIPAGLQRWQGPRESCEDLLLIHEQGYGDAFQFLRYANLLRPHAERLIYQGPKKLHDLVLQSGLVDACTPEGEHWTSAQQRPMRWEALLSLPLRLGATPADPLISTPYLRADPERVAKWRKALVGSGPLVAIHWQGNPEHEMTISRGRSLPLAALAPLAAVPHVRLLSLQKGAGSEQLATCGFSDRFVEAQSLVNVTWDFAETAAILKACDLVVTSDSGLAHLAAALGRPTWILLMHIPEWRWGLHGTTTAWYPSARLWRQPQPGDWARPIERMVQVLTHWAATWGPTSE